MITANRAWRMLVVVAAPLSMLAATAKGDEPVKGCIKEISLDTLRNNAKLNPPYREPTKASNASGDKRHPVINAQRIRQSVFPKD